MVHLEYWQDKTLDRCRTCVPVLDELLCFAGRSLLSEPVLRSEAYPVDALYHRTRQDVIPADWEVLLTIARER